MGATFAALNVKSLPDGTLVDARNRLLPGIAAEAEPGSRLSETLKVMERRLLTAIINPAMVASWVLGLWLAWDGGWLRSGWLHGKLALVLVLSAIHGLLVRWTHDLAADRNRHSQKFYRVINEVPTILMIGIVILVVVKPF